MHGCPRNFVPAPTSLESRPNSAIAQTQVAQAEQATDVARATLAQFTGLDPAGLIEVFGKACRSSCPRSGRSAA